MFQRGPDQPRLIVKKPVPFLSLNAHDIRDIGLQDDGSAIGGPMFRDLNPAVAGQADIKDNMVIRMPRHALRDPILRGFVLGQRQVFRLADKRDIVEKPQAGQQFVLNIGHVHAKTTVAHDKVLVEVEQGKPFPNRFNRIGQVGPRRFGFPVRLGQTGVGIVEKIKRAFQIMGARAHLLLKHRRALKLRIGRTRGVGRFLDPAHQRSRDFQQLFVLTFQRVIRVDQGLMHIRSFCRRINGNPRQGLVHM